MKGREPVGSLADEPADANLENADVRQAATAVTTLLIQNAHRTWSVQAGELEWSVSETVARLIDVCGSYAVHLALGSTRRLCFDLRPHADASATEHAAVLDGLSEHLAQVIDRAPNGTRAWHRFGPSDTSGIAAMACDELLVHGSDIASGLALPFEPNHAQCRLILNRLFPWAPQNGDQWQTLRWSNGRIALPGHPRLPPDWSWWSAPLAEWDGRSPD